MPANTCKSCRWWDQPSGECGKVDNTERAPTVITPTLFTLYLFTPDDHGLCFRLVTGPDFGCVLHEAKP